MQSEVSITCGGPWSPCGRSITVGIALVAAAVGGCGARAGSGVGDPASSSVGRLARLVERYRIDHRGQLPRSEQELRGFAAAIAPTDLATLGVPSVEACFVSDRDGQPLVLTLGRDGAAKGDASVICYERQGRDGLHLVGMIGGNVEAADAARFAELVPSP